MDESRIAGAAERAMGAVEGAAEDASRRGGRP